MTFFENLLLLLLAAVVLLQLARRLRLPYPAMLAAAGVLEAYLPGAPAIALEPGTALALLIAPVILDTAFDFPAAAALRFVVPLIAFAVFAVLATALGVASLGYHMLALPLSAALVLGAIVAPPDAAAATAVLSTVTVPRSVEEVLRGESLFNDATALLLYSGALAVQQHGGITLGVGLHLAAAVPGGLLLGWLLGKVVMRIQRVMLASLGGNLLQFVLVYLIWLLAEHLQLSAVLCTITFAMTLAQQPEMRGHPRSRVQSYAVWSAVVFTLNVLAFLLMGMQARSIVQHMQSAPLAAALRFAGMVVLTVIAVRLAFVVGFNRLNAWRAAATSKTPPPSTRKALLIGWAGMRGFVTLATALALPANFPQRDTVVLTAFAVVLGTLVLQGLTLRPVIALLGMDDHSSGPEELDAARSQLATVALASLAVHTGPAADSLRYPYQLDCAASRHRHEPRERAERHDLGLEAIRIEREELENLRNNNALGITGFLQLQEELDWRELALLRDEERRIEENA